MFEWIDRLLLSPSRETVDLIAMILAAAAILYVGLLIVKLAWSIGKHADDNEPGKD